jgi:DNA repair protein RadC
MKDYTYTRRPSDIFPTGVFELSVSYKRKAEKRQQILKSKDVSDIAHTFYEDGSIQYAEQFYILLCDRHNFVFSFAKISQGSLSGTVVDPRMIFQTALLSHASSVILIHNHPSGVVKPSQQDIDLTKKIREGGKLLEVQVLDHVIISDDKETFFSFADEGMM